MIHQRALLSDRKKRHEDGWNQEVVKPLLDLAFDEEKLYAPGHQVTKEVLTSATIAADFVPRVQASGLPAPKRQARDSDTDSVTSRIAASLSAVSSSTGESGYDSEKEELHTKSASKKVDYGIVVVPGHGTPLQKAVSRVTRNNQSAKHINQPAT